MDDYQELKKALAIDKYSLDDEIIRQPSLFFMVAEAHTTAAAMRDALKEKLAQLDASLYGKIRIKLENEGSKFTEAYIKNEIEIAPKRVKASRAYLESKEQTDKLLALKEAFAQRNYMIRDLCNLYVTGYFESNSIKQNTEMKDVSYSIRKGKINEVRKKKREKVNE